MKTKRVATAVASGLLVIGGFAGPAYAQTDPGPDPNEGGVTETADLDEGTEAPDPDDAIDSPEEAAENEAGEGEEVAEGEVGAADDEGADATDAEAPEGADSEEADSEEAEPADSADDPAEVQGATLSLQDDDEDDDDEDGEDEAPQSTSSSGGAGGAVNDTAIAGSPTFTG